MYCGKCGYQLKDNWKTCPNCSGTIENNNIGVNNNSIQHTEVEKSEEKQGMPYSNDEKIFIIVFLASVGAGVFGLVFFQPLSIFLLVALVTIVTAFIKYPKNRAIKVLFWLFLAATALSIIALIIIMIMCMQAVSDCINMCGSF